MTTPGQAGQARALSQLVATPLTPAAIFLVVTVNPGPEAETAVRSLCADIANLLRAVGFRDLEGRLSCIVAFGSEVWDRLFGVPRPAELHPFREFRSGARHAIATPGRHPVPHPRAAHGSVLRAGEPDHERDRRRRRGRRRGSRLLAFSTSAIFWALSTAPKTRTVRRHSTPPSSATRTRHSPAAAMSSCRNTCTTSMRGTRCRPRRRSASSAAPN